MKMSEVFDELIEKTEEPVSRVQAAVALGEKPDDKDTLAVLKAAHMMTSKFLGFIHANHLPVEKEMVDLLVATQNNLETTIVAIETGNIILQQICMAEGLGIQFAGLAQQVAVIRMLEGSCLL